MEFESECKICGTPIYDRNVRRGNSWVKQTWCSRPCESEIQQKNKVFYKQTPSGITLNEENPNFIKQDDMEHPSRVEKHNAEMQDRLHNYFSQNK